MKYYQNWSKSVQFKPQKIEKPVDEKTIQKLVLECAEKKMPIRVVGSGHSFSPLIETEGVLLSLDAMQGLIDLEESSGLASIWGGTKLWQLNEILFKKGRGLENLGDIDRQSIAGTISTGTHGTGAKLGSISTQLRELTLVSANGDLITCSENQNAEIFKAAQVSLGALGVITRMKMTTLPAYRMKLIQKREPLEQCLNELVSRTEENRHFEFFSFPYSKNVQSKFTNITSADADKKSLKDYVNDVLVENTIFKILSEISKWIPGTTRAISKFCGAVVGNIDKTHWAHEIYTTPRLVRFQEMEFSVPKESLPEVVREIQEMIQRKKVRVHFPIECRFVKADDIWLSPAYGRDSAYVAVHSYLGMEYQKYFEAAQSIFRNHQGRPHWGKMHFMGSKDLAPLYPRWSDFERIRKQLDPKGLFLNAALRKIFL